MFWNPLTLAVSVATIVWSTITKPKTTRTTRAESSANNASVAILTPETWIFVSGMACTVMLQYGSECLVRNSYYQRMKTMFLKWTRMSALDKSGEFLHTPTNLVSLSSTTTMTTTTTTSLPLLLEPHRELVTTPPCATGDNNKRLLLGSRIHLIPRSSSYSSSCNYSVTLLTLQPRCELASHVSPPGSSMEFFYVVSGTGLVSQQGIIPTQTITEGDAFVVDPWTIRWISNKQPQQSGGSGGNSCPLILLRVAQDNSHNHNSNNNPYTQIRLDPNINPNQVKGGSGGTFERLFLPHGFVDKVQRAAAEYYTATTSKSGATTTTPPPPAVQHK